MVQGSAGRSGRGQHQNRGRNGNMEGGFVFVGKSTQHPKRTYFELDVVQSSKANMKIATAGCAGVCPRALTL